MNASSVTSAAVNPATFHLDCVDHLCQLECDLSEVRPHAGEGPSLAKLSAVRRMLTDICDFAEPRFSAEAFSELAGPMHKMYKVTMTLERMFSDASWASVKRLFGQRSGNASDVELHQTYEQLHRDLNQFLVEYFVLCVKRFSTGSEEKRSLLESVDAFISEIDRIWE